MSKPKGKLTETHMQQIKIIIAETPEIKLTKLIEMLSLPITLSGLCHRLKRENIPYNGRHIYTEGQNQRIREAFSEKPDIRPDELITKLSLPLTPYQVRKKLTRMGLMPKSRIVLNKDQIEQIKAELSERPDIPLSELILTLSLQITTAGLRNRLNRMGIPYKGKRAKPSSESDEGAA